jgi:GxxExxY protein
MKVDLLYPDISYKIVGCAFEVFNAIGGGHQEKVFQKAFAISMKAAGLEIKEQVFYPVKFKEHVVGKNYFDFSINDKIIVEIKTSDRFSKAQFDQLENYLLVADLKLGILISFCKTEVKFKRVLNTKLLNKEK